MSLEESDKAAAAVQKTPNRVTLADLEANVDSVEFINPESDPLFTIAVVKLKNGYVVTGESAAADPANFNAELGQKFAKEAALKKVWPLMGYALRDKLAKGETYLSHVEGAGPLPQGDKENPEGQAA